MTHTPSQQAYADKVVASLVTKGVDAVRTGDGIMCGVILTEAARHLSIGPYAVYNVDADTMADNIMTRVRQAEAMA